MSVIPPRESASKQTKQTRQIAGSGQRAPGNGKTGCPCIRLETTHAAGGVPSNLRHMTSSLDSRHHGRNGLNRSVGAGIVETQRRAWPCWRETARSAIVEHKGLMVSFPTLRACPPPLPSIFYLSTPDLAGCYRTVCYSRDGKSKGREGAGIAPYQDKGAGVDGLDNPGKDQKKSG